MSRIKCYMCKNFSRWGLYTGWCIVKKKDKATMSSKCKDFVKKVIKRGHKYAWKIKFSEVYNGKEKRQSEREYRATY